MRVDSKIFLTARGEITADPRKAATVFKACGSGVTPSELLKYPALGQYIPEIRANKERSLAAAEKEDAEKEDEKLQKQPADKRVRKSPNKAGGK
jgi:hypothetical protein